MNPNDPRICPRCYGDNSKVIIVRTDRFGLLVRRRECLMCGKRWNTAEIDHDLALEAVRREA